jgi:type VI secretion system protein ImpL
MKLNPRIVVAVLLFIAYEVLVWALTARLAHGTEFWLFGSVLTALGLTALIVYLSVSALLRKQHPSKEEPDTARPEKQSGAQFIPDMSPVMALIREANRTLARSRTLNNKQAKTSLSDLPLYIIAGPAGSGKTTTFLASGLSPELLAGHVQRDATVLPTTHCNLWYASDAVFVEAGSQFFSDAGPGWKALLEQLRGGGKSLLQQTWQQGGQTNVRGLVLFCDVSVFMGGADSAKIGALARKTQERMQAMGEVLGSSFPVYVVFSKADQLPHFDEFFYRLAEDESRQVLGCSISTADMPASDEVYAEAQSKRLTQAFNALYARLAEKRLRFLAREPEKNRRPGIYEFPRELKRVRDSLVQFLIESFRPNPLQPGPLLRGFYFTGMQQVAIAAAPTDVSAEPHIATSRNLEATVLFQPSLHLSEPAEAVPENAGAVLGSRVSFAVDLFHKVVLRDPLGRLTAVRNVRTDKRRRILAISVVCACCILVGCFAGSWWGNLRLLTNVERATPPASLHTAGNGSPAMSDFQSMEQLRLALQPLLEYDRNGAPWRLRWGLYSGGRVLERAYDVYFQLFQRYFLNKTRNILQAQLQELAPRKSTASYDGVYDDLKAYRMITSGACPADASFLAPVFFQTWSSGLSLPSDASQLARQQVNFYASELTRRNPFRLEEDAAAVANGRDYLAQFGGIDRLLRGLIADADLAPRQAVRVIDLAPKFHQVLTGPGEMQAAFTLEGWNYVQQRLQDPQQLSLGEPCVLGSAAQSTARPDAPQSGQLKTLYAQAYIHAWKNFIASTSVQPFHSTAEAAKNLDTLADNRSPLLAVLFLVSHNTSFAAKTLPKQVKTPDAIGEIDRIFQPVHEVVNPGNQDRLIGDPNRDFMNALGDLQQIMAQSQSRPPADPDPTLQQNAQQAVDKGLEAVRQIAQRFNISGSEGIDIEVRRLLESPFRSSMKLITLDAAKAGADKVAGSAKTLCAKLGPLENIFPFNPQSTVDATTTQLSAVFAPRSGALSTFEQQLGKLIVFQGGHWVQNPEVPQPRLTPQALAWLDQLTAISEAFFPNRAPSPAMSYVATPLPIPGAEAVTLEIDGQTLTTTATQTQSRTLVWPATERDGVLVRVKEGANIPFASYDGAWGIFRLLNDADPRPPGSHIIELSKVRRGHGRAESVLDGNNKPIQVRLQLSGAPGRPDVFEKNFFQIHCPTKFVQ